jgi:hypothetical protein
MKVGDTIRANSHKEHQGIIIGFAAKDFAAQVAWFTPDCNLGVHWKPHMLTVVKEGPELEPTLEQTKLDRFDKAIRSARGTILMIGLKEGHPLYEQVDKAYHTLAVAQG